MYTEAEIGFDSTIGPGGEVVVATPVGEFDLCNATDFRTRLLAVLERRPRMLVLDLSATMFIDSVILSALVAVHGRAEEYEIGFCLTNLNRWTAKPLEITGLDTYLSIHPTVDATVRSITRPVAADGASGSSRGVSQELDQGSLGLVDEDLEVADAHGVVTKQSPPLPRIVATDPGR